MTKSNNKIMKLSPMTSSKNNVMRYKFHLNDVINKKIQDHLRLLEHSIHCLECNSKNCQKMKMLISHRKSVKTQSNQCRLCHRIDTMFDLHSKICFNPNCPLDPCLKKRNLTEEMEHLQI